MFHDKLWRGKGYKFTMALYSKNHVEGRLAVLREARGVSRQKAVNFVLRNLWTNALVLRDVLGQGATGK